MTRLGQTNPPPQRRPRGTLGVLGGMGPMATAEFLRLLAETTPAATDQEHPRLLMLSDPATPDRTRAVLGTGPDPSPHLREGLAELTHWGADVLAVPCNTAHAFIETFRARLAVPVIDIVDATLGQALGRSPEGGWLMATTGTVVSGIYQHRAARLGYPLHVPDDGTQEQVHRISTLVKSGRTLEAGLLLTDVTKELWSRHDLPVLAACTELPIAYTAAALSPDSMISSLRALAEACVAALYDEQHSVPYEEK